MKTLILAGSIISIVLCACATHKPYKEYIIDTRYNQVVGGYYKGALLEVGVPIWYKDYLSDSLPEHHSISPLFDRDSNNQVVHRLIIGTDTTGRYMTSKGIKIGDSVQKVEELYGKPPARSFFEGYLMGYPLEYPGPFYRNLLFVEDTSTHKVIGIMIGDFSQSWQ